MDMNRRSFLASAAVSAFALFGAAATAAERQAVVTVPDGKGLHPVVVVPCERAATLVPAQVGLLTTLRRRGFATVEVSVSAADCADGAALARTVAEFKDVLSRLGSDVRIDRTRFGMAGLGLGGPVAFHVGLADPRICAVATFGSGFGRNLGVNGNDAEIVRSAAKPYLALMSPEETTTEFRAAMGDRRSCAGGALWRRYAKGVDKGSTDQLIWETVAFCVCYVRDGGKLPPRYAGDRQRLLDRDVEIGGTRFKCVRIPAIVTAPNGDIVFVADARPWNSGDLIDCQPTRTVIRRSSDNGRTWTEPRLIHERPWNEDEKWGLSDPSLVVDRIAKKVFYFVNGMEYVHGFGKCLKFVSESSDDGRTWGTLREITSDIHVPGIVADGRLSFISSGHGIQTRDGTLLHVAVAQKFGNSLFGSDDHGRTWKRFGKPTMKVPDEAKIEELEDGTWLINSRDTWVRSIHRSADRGETWTSTREPGLPDSITNGALLKVPFGKDGEVLLFSNSSRACRPRTHLTVRASRDGGRTWNAGILIDPGFGSYSDMTLMPDGRIGVVYEAEGEKAIDFVAVPLKEILDSPME